MRKETGTQWLPALQGLLVVAVFVLLTLFMNNSRTASYQQSVAINHQQNALAFNLIIQDSAQYASTNQAIEPVLNSIGIQINRVPTAAPANRH